jgi:transcriptional regulator with XRE-family HTH domain
MANNGAGRLLAWMHRSGLKQCEVAQALQVTPAFVCQVLKGVRRPGLKVGVRIEDVTGIPLRSWVATRVPRRTAKL